MSEDGCEELLMKGWSRFVAAVVAVAGMVGMVGMAVAQSQSLQRAERGESYPPRGEVLFERALVLTGEKDFSGAIAILERASQSFSRRGDAAAAYKSQALGIYLQAMEEHRQAMPGTRHLPLWYQSAICLGEPTCQYAMTHIAPELPAGNFGGILILEQEIDRVQYPSGSSSPINAVLHVQVVPPAGEDEFFSSLCQRRGEQTPGLIGLAQYEGYEDADLYTEIRLAWQPNLATERIESIPVAEVDCINPCPGGC